MTVGTIGGWTLSIDTIDLDDAIDLDDTIVIAVSWLGRPGNSYT